jgi:hypothetical protein
MILGMIGLRLCPYEPLLPPLPQDSRAAGRQADPSEGSGFRRGGRRGADAGFGFAVASACTQAPRQSSASQLNTARPSTNASQ